MAWNPSPEVQVARDAAEAIRGVTKAEQIDMCIVTWIDNDSRAGYASYGRTPVLCGMARRVADVAYEAINDSEKFDAICHAVIRGDASATDGSGIDFDGLEAEVVGKLRLLKASLAAEMDKTTRKLIVRDLVLPAAELLARFCACVNVEEEVKP
ncbi:MAG: hypothetical protein IT434_05335 [Phycisphaerales bacterium]|jgi:hypothetical protein|nr:hypothetical protein [Phycisphaerales bacterium]